MATTTPSQATLDLLASLVAFDTTSRHSNLELIGFVQAYLGDLGVESELVHDATGAKANLFATLGPGDRPGIALSGHTDVVPVDGQPWSSDPFALTERAGRLYGRGTADMKGFVATCLALAPEFLGAELATPVHLCLSHDEEVGCIGVRSLLRALEARAVRPRACIVGEPTGMRVVRAHKGKLSVRCRVRGLEAHSSMTHAGVNAVEAAAEVIARLKWMGRRFRDRGPYDEELSPAYTTVHTGLVRGGTQLNIVPRDCHFDFEIRHLPGDDPEDVLAEIRRFAETHVAPEMTRVDPRSGFDWEPLARIPGLDSDEDEEIVQLAKHLTGDNRSAKVSFGTEAGLFQASGVPTVICGPGHIDQAHKPDEYVTPEQLSRCEGFLRGLLEHSRA